MNTCPVCAYNQLEFPPTDYSICACCGTEFGYDDRALSHAELTKLWVDNRCPWFDLEEPKPPGWNGYQQLINGGMKWAVPKFANYKIQESPEISSSGRIIWDNSVVELRAA